jgi:hypothetical protein
MASAQAAETPEPYGTWRQRNYIHGLIRQSNPGNNVQINLMDSLGSP